MTMLAAGFFRELAYTDDNCPSIHDSVGRMPRELKDQVLAYLRAGHEEESLLAVTTDVLDEHEHPSAIGPLVFLTDGTWSWPSDLAYYVEMYDCAVPDEFVEHMRAVGWRPPPWSPPAAGRDDETDYDPSTGGPQ